MKVNFHVDLDGADQYSKYAEKTFDGNDYLYSYVDNFLEMFDDFDVKASFFVIGRDILDEDKVRFIKKISEHGHNLENHTFSHPFGFSRLSYRKKQFEILQCEKLIKNCIGKKPKGFRAPGYDIDKSTFHILKQLRYEYDSSIIPTFVYPLIMFADSFLNRKPFHTHGPPFKWAFESNNVSIIEGMKEIPVTTMPYLKIPFHATIANSLTKDIVKVGKRLCEIQGLDQITYLFHLMDMHKNSKNCREIMKLLVA